VTGCRLLSAGSAKAKPPAEDSRRLGLFTQADLASLTKKVRRRVVRWFRMQRLSVQRGEEGRIARVRYVLPRHKAANWVGPGRGRKSTRPGANGVVELSPFEFLDRLADLVLPPRKHRHRLPTFNKPGVFAPNHKLRLAVTALAIGNSGKLHDAATGGHAVGGHAARRDATGDSCDSCDQPRSHDTSRMTCSMLHVEKLRAEQLCGRNSSMDGANKAGRRIEFPQDRLQVAEVIRRDQIGLVDDDDVGEFHLIDKQLDMVPRVVFIKADSAVAEFVPRAIVTQKIDRIDHGDERVESGQR
jgi:hypothetical protein